MFPSYCVVCSRFTVFLWATVLTQTPLYLCDTVRDRNDLKGLRNEVKELLLSIESEHPNEKSCSVIPKRVQFSRFSEKHGFHRDIHSSLSILLDPAHHCTSCDLLLIESLPSGLFVDLYQAASAVEFGGPQILAFEEIDLEKPAYLSGGHTILVYPSSPSQIVALNSEFRVNFTIEMPVHLRYHRPSSDTAIHSAHISMLAPYLLIHCTGTSAIGTHVTDEDLSGLLYRAPCNATSKTSCLWRLLPQNPKENSVLHFDVPIGQQHHTLVVTTVTILATVAGTVALLVTMLKTSAKAKPD
ncbi:phosphatidylinositol-glycan biosynthesis class X protein-like [Acanthaster planci]|uniref:Phosphatidylinositol-glycan biosynthesis class X protein n=1 Tax=Acanthaster planci TaxID=133434 RepID=A0A8B7XJZ2_ACAPL|nr:phosphatidylinositol-glycan biosynthesis class X protein-like [Acanthaster planci]